MNGARSTYMRKGYLLTALAAAVLLAASSGTAYAQSIGFVGSSGSVSETASLEPGALEGPHEITVKVSGLPPVGDPRRDVEDLGTVSLRTSHDVSIAIVTRSNPRSEQESIEAGDAYEGGDDADADGLTAVDFTSSDEVTLVVAQSATGGGDNNWRDEPIKLTLDAGPGISVNPAVYTLTVDDGDVAPVAKFNVPSFTLTEGSQRMAALEIVEGRRGAGVPTDALEGQTGMVSVRVSNSQMVSITACPEPNTAGYNTTAVYLDLDEDGWGTPDAAVFGRTGVLQTMLSVSELAVADADADFTVMACGDMAGFTDPQITLTILSTSLVEKASKMDKIGDITIGSPLMITIDSDEAAPTLSFSPTDVTIDEGGSTSTRLIADGQNANEVGMVKLSVEGDAMVSLMHEDTMLEEMNGYVYVDLGTGNTARLTAMSHSDPDLMDGDMAYKAWKLMEGSSDANIGDDYWFRVDVRGSTAVPALPLVGQLLLALFLMAGGARLYRRRQG